MRLGERLIKERLISPVQLETALKEQVRTGELLGEVLCNLGYVSRENVKRTLAKNAGIEFISLGEIKVPENILKLVPRAFALRHKVLPLTIDNDTLQVGMLDPFDIKVIDELEALTGYFVLVVTATDEELNQALHRCYYTTAVTLTNKPLDQHEIDELVKKVAVSDNPIIIYDERCNCRKLLAWTIHAISSRRGRPFITQDCKGTTSVQLEGELFGHARGFFRSFFHEGEGHKGKLELAEGGTLFLDEIGDMPLSTQTKVLRVLLTGEFERGGGTEVRKTDVRIIATTSINLDRAVEEGTFDKDLYFRLNTIPIELLPLQENKANIPLWAGFFLENIRHRRNSPGLRLSGEALQSLMEYHWPGNLVELESCLERAAIMAKGELISSECLSIPLSSGQREKKAPVEDNPH